MFLKKKNPFSFFLYRCYLHSVGGKRITVLKQGKKHWKTLRNHDSWSKTQGRNLLLAGKKER